MTAKHGWCLTGHHTQCRVQITEHRCSCTCHPSDTTATIDECNANHSDVDQPRQPSSTATNASPSSASS